MRSRRVPARYAHLWPTSRQRSNRSKRPERPRPASPTALRPTASPQGRVRGRKRLPPGGDKVRLLVSGSAWLRIVRNLRLNVGPTLPFILGAIRDPIGVAPDSRVTGEDESFELLRLMDEEAPADCGISIQWSPSVAAHVAACVSEPGLTWRASGFKATSRDGLGARLWELYGA